MEEERDKISKAFIEFQKEMPEVKLDSTVKVKTKTGAEYKFKYATLANILKKTLPILTLKGLGLTQTFSEETLITTLIHESGQTWNSVIGIDLHSGTMQEMGSRISYLKRYGISAMLGIVAEEDDDANIASGNNYQQDTKPPLTEPQAKTQGGLKITDITVNPKNASRFHVKINETLYYTFSRTLAEKAKKAKIDDSAILNLQSESSKFGNELKSFDVGGQVVDGTPPTEEITPEKCHELADIYKGIISEINAMPDLEKWEEANHDTINKIKGIEPEAYVAIMVAYDRKFVELKEKEVEG